MIMEMEEQTNATYILLWPLITRELNLDGLEYRSGLCCLKYGPRGRDEYADAVDGSVLKQDVPNKIMSNFL